MHWDEVPLSQAQRGSRRQDASRGHDDVAAGDFVYYNLLIERFCDAREARLGSRREREHPRGYPHGYVYLEDDEIHDIYRILRDAKVGDRGGPSTPSNVPALPAAEVPCGNVESGALRRTVRSILEEFGMTVGDMEIDSAVTRLRDVVPQSGSQGQEAEQGEVEDSEILPDAEGGEEN